MGKVTPTGPDRKRDLHRDRSAIGSAVNPDSTAPQGKRLLQWLLAATVLAVMVTVLVSPVLHPVRGRWSSALWNLLHVPGFFAITWGAHTLLPSALGRTRRIFYAATAAFALGALTEIVQGHIGRSASLDDLLFDGVGIVLAVILLGRRVPWGARQWRAYVLFVAFALVLCLSPAWGRDLVDLLRSMKENH